MVKLGIKPWTFRLAGRNLWTESTWHDLFFFDKYLHIYLVECLSWITIQPCSQIAVGVRDGESVAGV